MNDESTEIHIERKKKQEAEGLDSPESFRGWEAITP